LRCCVDFVGPLLSDPLVRFWDTMRKKEPRPDQAGLFFETSSAPSLLCDWKIALLAQVPAPGRLPQSPAVQTGGAFHWNAWPARGVG
jgi:hypothetical protein